MIRMGSGLTGALAVLALGSVASAATLVSYKPTPDSPSLPEFVFGGGPIPSFQAGPGSAGNGDGQITPVSNQTPGGLQSGTPLTIPGIPGSDVAPGATEFYDTTLVLTGLQASGPATLFGSVIIQPLDTGFFQLFSTDPVGPGTPTLLLQGTIAATTFIVGSGDSGGVFNSSNVSYTGGAIYNQLIAQGGSPNNNSMSISMVDISPPFAIGGSGYLNNFSANATGVFNVNVLPEPTGLGVLGIAAAGLLARRRRSA
jgi:hypothetical protein